MTARPATNAEQVLKLLGGRIVSQAISTGVDIGVFDAVAATPMTTDALAEHLDCYPDMLNRLLTVLAGELLLEIDDTDTVRLTELGRELVDGRLGPLAVFMGSEGQWTPWSSLPRAIRTGKSAFEVTHGRDLYQWLEDHPEDARLYDRSIDKFTTEQACALAQLPDFATLRHVVDVGGGRGTMLIELLRQWPHLRGTLFDVPHVIAAAKSRFSDAGVSQRCTFASGSFFETIPDGADAYLLKHILHNWDDASAIRILHGCRAAMAPNGRLYVVEGILPPQTVNTTARMLDLEMMVLFGRGGERSKPQFRRLFHKAGFRLHGHSTPLGHFARLLIGHPRAHS